MAGELRRSGRNQLQRGMAGAHAVQEALSPGRPVITPSRAVYLNWPVNLPGQPEKLRPG